MTNDDIVLSNIVRIVKDYKVSNDERTLFDWLVFTQRGFGVEKPFRHSIQQVKTATNVTRYSQHKCFSRFVELGFLTIAKECYNNNEYRSFFVDYSTLAKKEVLGQIVRKGTETFSAMLKMFEQWAKEQTKGEKPMTKKEQKAKEAKLASVEPLLNTLNSTWKERIEMFNNGKLTSGKPVRAKTVSMLVCKPTTKKALANLRNVYDDTSIRYAFEAYADNLLTGETKTDQILPYFLTYDEGTFVVVDRFLEYHALHYGYTNT
jgi:hypothetical protein